MPTPTLLVFPVNVDSALPVIKMARALGYRIIGASSVQPYPDIPELETCIHLPFITAPGFAEAFAAARAEHGISHVHAPHHGVWSHLNSQLQSSPELPYVLCGKHPFRQNWENFAPSMQWAEEVRSDKLAGAATLPGSALAPPLSTAAYASLHRGFLRIPGESDVEKLSALSAIARLTPRGDVVEIGSLYGRSAYALGRLAHAHGIGACICVDPWRMEVLTDQGKQADILQSGASFIDFDQIFLEFLATAAEVPGMAYIRQPSATAITSYLAACAAGELRPAGLPAVPVSGRIALLHIDGNHRYDQVVLDIQTWEPYLMEGGWLLLDDYVWAFGDGPKIAGDELLQSGAFDHMFTCSDTLFLRKGSSRRA